MQPRDWRVPQQQGTRCAPVQRPDMHGAFHCSIQPGTTLVFQHGYRMFGFCSGCHTSC